jgi:hypothetical protein
VPVTTLADGTAIVVITPSSGLYGGYNLNGQYLPFVQVANTTSQFPFVGAGTYTYPGPFNSQFPSTVEFGVDAVFLDFI